MEAELLIENIEKHLPLLSRILPTHTQVPILSNILISASKKGVVLKATDLEIGVEISIPAKINREGAVTVPGKQFIEAIANLPKDKILISEDKDSVRIVSRENKITFQSLSPLEFPELLKSKGVKIFSLEKERFDKMFEHLAFSASTDDIRPHLTGIFLAKKEKGLELVTTDGYRLTLKTIKEDAVSNMEESIIVSVRVVNEAISIKDDRVDVYINTEKSQVVFEGGDVVLVGRLIEGKFPDYNRVIPKEKRTTVVVGREEFVQNARLASVFAKEQSNVVSVSIKDSEMTLSSKTSGVGEGSFAMDCEKTGEDNKITFNIRYLLDALKNFEGEKITVMLNNAVSPAILEDDKKTFKHVIMPIKTED